MSEQEFPITHELLFSPAKINTYLDVEVVEVDYHSLFLNFILVDFGDLMLFKPEYTNVYTFDIKSQIEVSFEQARELFLQRLDIAMFAQGKEIVLSKESNLIYKAIKAFLESPFFPQNSFTIQYLFTCKLTIQVFKRIPMQMGLGGGSSNAGTALVYLGKILCPVVAEFEQLVRGLVTVGSDVPVFVYGISGFYRGRGEIYVNQHELLKYCQADGSLVTNLNHEELVANYQVERDLSFSQGDFKVVRDYNQSFERTFNLYHWQAQEQLKHLELDNSEILTNSSLELAKKLHNAYLQHELQSQWRNQLLKSSTEQLSEPLVIALPHQQRNDTTKIFAKLRQMYNQGLISYTNLSQRVTAHYHATTGWYNVFEHYLGLEKFANSDLNEIFTLTGTGAASFASTARLLNEQVTSRDLLMQYIMQPQNFDFDLIGCHPLPMSSNYCS